MTESTTSLFCLTKREICRFSTKLFLGSRISWPCSRILLYRLFAEILWGLPITSCLCGKTLLFSIRSTRWLENVISIHSKIYTGEFMKNIILTDMDSVIYSRPRSIGTAIPSLISFSTTLLNTWDLMIWHSIRLLVLITVKNTLSKSSCQTRMCLNEWVEKIRMAFYRDSQRKTCLIKRFTCLNITISSLLWSIVRSSSLSDTALLPSFRFSWTILAQTQSWKEISHWELLPPLEELIWREHSCLFPRSTQCGNTTRHGSWLPVLICRFDSILFKCLPKPKFDIQLLMRLNGFREGQRSSGLSASSKQFAAL